MKQLTKLGMLFAGLGLLASCSNDNINDPTPNSPNVDMSGKTEGNISFNICTFPNNGSRTDEKYEEGTTAENAINDNLGYVYIFGGDSEANATFVEGAILTFKDPAVANDAYLEKVAIAAATAKLSGTYSTSNNYYAAMVLNATEGNYPTYDFPVAETPVVNPTLRAGSSKLADLQAFLAEKIVDATAGFLMSSAPSYDGNGNVTYMAQLSADWVKNRTDDYTAANVYVQRVAAKVEVTTTGITYGENNSNPDRIAVQRWTLDLLNPTSYLVQNAYNDFSTFTYKNRFFAYEGTGNDHNRLFWSRDVNYDGSENDVTPAVALSDFSATELDDYTVFGSALYCHENTFSVAKMNKKNSTRALVYATCVPQGLKTYTGVTDAEGTLVPDNTPTSFFKNVDGTVWTISGLERAIALALGYKEGTTDYYNVKITVPQTAQAGMTVEQLKIQLDGGAALTQSANADILGLISTKLRILGANLDFYQNGICYYQMIVRHFSNTATGLDELWAMDANAYADATINNKLNASPAIAGDAKATNLDDSFLGRYGVVRNNWYQLNISSVSGIGEPVPPTPTDTPDDDPKEQRIKFTVNILSWALRKHDYKL